MDKGPVFDEAEAADLADTEREILSATSTPFSLVLGSPIRIWLSWSSKSEPASERNE